MEYYSRQQLQSEVDGILMNLFELDRKDLKSEKNLFTDLGLDSLDAIDMVIAFQSKFDIKPDNAELQRIRTLGDVYELVYKYYEKVIHPD